MTEPIYTDDAVTVYCGDAFELLPEIIDRHGRADHMISDVPYSEKTHAGARTGSTHGRLIQDTDFTSVDAAWVSSLVVACDARRWSVFTCDHDHCHSLEHRPPTGVRFLRYGCWAKLSGYAPQLSGDRPATGWEAVAIMHSGGQRPRWNGGGQSAVWTDASVRVAACPTQKPLALVKSFVSLFSDIGELVIDPCAGSGTTGRACKDLGRRCVLIEKDPGRAEIAAKRMRQEILL